ncbi:aspartic peptidase domain-containing protein [Zopfochytrium polystomum]|nr:aspartic peptidase domain-containing protein [Zopfochytrium polystomum]
MISPLLALLVLLPLLGGGAIAAPAPMNNPTEKVTIPISKNTTNCPKAAIRALSRWSYRMSGHVKGRNKTRRATNVPLVNQDDDLYTIAVTVGSSQAFTLHVDTGSADTWFRGPSCTSDDGSCGVSGQNVFKTSDSAVKATSWTFSQGYASGSVSGKVYQGPMTVGNLTTSSSFAFGVTTYETGFTTGGDGELGLAPPGFSKIAASGAGSSNSDLLTSIPSLSTKSFGVYLSRRKDGDKGELTLGGVDNARFTGSFSYFPLSSNNYWQASLKGAKYTANGKTGALDATASTFIADTGTTLIALDTAAADAINTAIGAPTFNSDYGLYPIDCKLTGPDVIFNISGISFAIPSSVYVVDDGASFCFSGFSRGVFSSSDVVILGDVFMRAWYAHFDKANSRFGFAKIVH